MREIWDLVDDLGNKTGVMYDRYSGEDIPKGLHFTVVEIWVKVGNSLLITQRHPNKWAGLSWEVTGGGVLATETTREAAVRELSEETGITAKEGDLIFLGRIIKPKVMVESFLLSLSELPQLLLQESEVVDSRYVSECDFLQMIDKFTEGTRERYGLYKEKIFGQII